MSVALLACETSAVVWWFKQIVVSTSEALQRQMGDTGVSNKKQRWTWVGRDYVSEGHCGVALTKGSTSCPGADSRGLLHGGRRPGFGEQGERGRQGAASVI